jgi:hypothetical protein
MKRMVFKPILTQREESGVRDRDLHNLYIHALCYMFPAHVPRCERQRPTQSIHTCTLLYVPSYCQYRRKLVDT